MKLRDLLSVLEPGTPFAIGYELETYKYECVEELCEDFVFYEEIRDKVIYSIWYSKSLYNCMVIDLA